jgi:hypothetical protein
VERMYVGAWGCNYQALLLWLHAADSTQECCVLQALVAVVCSIHRRIVKFFKLVENDLYASCKAAARRSQSTGAKGTRCWSMHFGPQDGLLQKDVVQYMLRSAGKASAGSRRLQPIG